MLFDINACMYKIKSSDMITIFVKIIHSPRKGYAWISYNENTKSEDVLIAYALMASLKVIC